MIYIYNTAGLKNDLTLTTPLGHYWCWVGLTQVLGFTI